MDQTVNVNTETVAKRTVSWLEIILKGGGLLAAVGTACYFLFNVYALINTHTKRLEDLDIQFKEINADLHGKVDRHEFKDLEDKVNRQYALFNERMTKDVDPMKAYIEYHKGWLDGSNLKK